jgi:hypothetical protein
MRRFAQGGRRAVPSIIRRRHLQMPFACRDSPFSPGQRVFSRALSGTAAISPRESLKCLENRA